ncbi:hypothetical protein HK104_004989 [Borealophlyctis nickersoniae]|nr:hypothetical protein HK104_004989 [Borealophlyctis nickersoniae]
MKTTFLLAVVLAPLLALSVAGEPGVKNTNTFTATNTQKVTGTGFKPITTKNTLKKDGNGVTVDGQKLGNNFIPTAGQLKKANGIFAKRQEDEENLDFASAAHAGHDDDDVTAASADSNTDTDDDAIEVAGGKKFGLGKNAAAKKNTNNLNNKFLTNRKKVAAQHTNANKANVQNFHNARLNLNVKNTKAANNAKKLNAAKKNQKVVAPKKKFGGVGLV